MPLFSIIERKRWIEAVVAVGCGAITALMVLRPFSDADYYWHLAVGRYIAEHHALPTRNLWSFTAPEHPFTATAWLFDLLLHAVWTAAGSAGVHLAIAGVAGAAWATTYLMGRQVGGSIGWSAAATLGAAAISAVRFVPRPHVVSYFFLALTAFWLVRLWEGRRWPLVAVPLLIALWSNFHAGAVFGAGATLGMLGAVAARRLWRLPAPVSLRAAGLCSAAAVAALVANPGGLELVRYGAFHLKDVNEVVVLSEFMTPGWGRYKAFWILAALGVLLAGLEVRRRPDQWLSMAWLLSFGVLATRAIRVVPKFLLVGAPYLAGAATRLEGALVGRRGGYGLARYGTPWLVPLAAVLLSEHPVAHWFRPLALGDDPYLHPEQLARWVERQGIEGRCFASWDVSGFVEHRLPASPVFIDPRLRAYPSSLYQELEKADVDQALFDELMDRYGVEWAFRGASFLRLSGIGRFREEEWAVVRWDETGQILLRRSVPRFASIIEREEFRHFRPGRALLQSFVELSGEERARWAEEVERLAAQSPEVTSAQLGLCLERARSGDLARAAEACDRALDLAERRERHQPGSMLASQVALAAALTQLGDVAARQGSREASGAAYKAALRVSEEAVGALAGLGRFALEEDPAEAKRYFEKALRLAPGQEALVRGLAEAQKRLGAD